jgi:hypothetical protein
MHHHQTSTYHKHFSVLHCFQTSQLNMGSQDISAEHAEQAKPDSGKSGDIATHLVDADSSNVTVTPELNRKCLRRIDLMLMPIMFVSFGLQYMDKSCLTGAALFGIVEDLDLYTIAVYDGKPALDLNKYSYASLIFYWGYLLGCRYMLSRRHHSLFFIRMLMTIFLIVVPGVYMAQRFPLGKYAGIIITLWGGVTICTVAVKSYEGLLVQR